MRKIYNKKLKQFRQNPSLGVLRSSTLGLFM